MRTTKTASSSTAVQVVRYEGKRTVVVKHIGSGKNEEEVTLLKQEARDWIETTSCQQSLFLKKELEKDPSQIIQLSKCKLLGVRHAFLYEILSSVFKIVGFHGLNKMLLDLVLIRIVEPASKLQSLELLEEFFGIKYSESDMYRKMSGFINQKEWVEKILIDFARRKLNFDFHLVLYDVTTLYFESFQSDNFRKCGFSKDNKSGQPQILVGLVVNKDGFPISFEIFEGNKFEGHTLLPSILALKDKYKIKNLTVVADAAMINKNNVKELLNNKLNYIVGARIGNLKHDLIKEISQKLNRINGKSLRLKTKNGYLICDFSAKRFYQDYEAMDKQIKKAKMVIGDPSLLFKNRYVMSTAKYSLNQELVEKADLLLGIKGYYTNLSKSRNFIIERYHDLWKIEKAFRIAKSDLKMRPIYHFKTETIKSHILICFMALSILKYLEIRTKTSSQEIIEILKSIVDARLLDTVSKEEIPVKMQITDEVKELLREIGLPY